LTAPPLSHLFHKVLYVAAVGVILFVHGVEDEEVVVGGGPPRCEGGGGEEGYGEVTNYDDSKKKSRKKKLNMAFMYRSFILQLILHFVTPNAPRKSATEKGGEVPPYSKGRGRVILALTSGVFACNMLHIRSKE
jgi:hypothetical protein